MRSTLLRTLLISATAVLIPISPASAESMRGVGTAPVTKDVNSTRALAEIGARKDVVRKLLVSIIGSENLPAVADKDITSLAEQIPTGNIVNREPSVIGKEYRLAIDVDIDGGWLTQRIKDMNIQLPSQRGGARIMLVLDSYVGVSTDSSKPLHEVIEYRKEVGSSYSDKSIEAYSEKERAAVSQSQKSAASARGSSAAGYSDRYGSAAGSSRASASAANSSKSAGAYSKSVSAVSKANVQSEEHDNTYFRKEVTYQGGIGKSGSATAAAAMLKGQLRTYSVAMDAATDALNRFRVERFDQLKEGPWQQFLSYVSGNGINYVVGGKLEVIKEGYDAESRQFLCSGTISVEGFSAQRSTTGVGDGGKTARASGGSEEECQSRVAEVLAKSLADQIGPQIMDDWRDRAREGQAARDMQARMATEGGEYNLTFRSPGFNFQLMRLITSTLNGLDSIQKPFITVSTGPKEVVYRVTYKSTDGQDLGMAVLGTMADKDLALSQSPMPTISGQSVTVCLVACQ